MTKIHVKTLAVSLAILMQPMLSAHALIVKNPVDLSPTSLQNSGATYGPNVVTSLPRDNDVALMNTDPNAPSLEASQDLTFNDLRTSGGVPEARNKIITDPVSDNDDVVAPISTTQSSAILENPNHISETTVMTDRLAQQQQQVEPTHNGAVGWSLAILALIVGAGIYIANRKRDPYTNNRMGL